MLISWKCICIWNDQMSLHSARIKLIKYNLLERMILPGWVQEFVSALSHEFRGKHLQILHDDHDNSIQLSWLIVFDTFHLLFPYLSSDFIYIISIWNIYLFFIVSSIGTLRVTNACRGLRDAFSTNDRKRYIYLACIR